MKSYVIRLSSWVYNDQSYDYDGHGAIGAVYSNFEEANNARIQLEREFLLNEFNGFFRFEVGPDSLEYQRERRVKISRYLHREFNFNPTILLNWLTYKIEMFDEKPLDYQLDELINLIGAQHYKVVEYPNSDSFEVLTAWINKEIIGRKEHIYLEGGDFGGPRFFLSEQEAFEHLLESLELKWEIGHFNRRTFFRKTIDELTDFPNILGDLISESHYLSHNESGLNIQFEIDKPTLGRLFKLLKEPILLFKRRELQDDDFAKINNKYLGMQIINIWKKIAERNLKYKSKNDYLNSLERLDIYKVELPVWKLESDYYPYSKYIREHLEKYFDAIFESYNSYLTINKKSFKLYGVIKSYEEYNSNKVEILIKTNHDEFFNLNWVGIGTGESIQISFTNAVQNWIHTYGDLWNDRLKEIISPKTVPRN